MWLLLVLISPFVPFAPVVLLAFLSFVSSHIEHLEQFGVAFDLDPDVLKQLWTKHDGCMRARHPQESSLLFD